MYKNISDENGVNVDNQLKDIKKAMSKINWYIESVNEVYNNRIVNSVVLPLNKSKKKDFGKRLG